jgi:hypothetical protein
MRWFKETLFTLISNANSKSHGIHIDVAVTKPWLGARKAKRNLLRQ